MKYTYDVPISLDQHFLLAITIRYSQWPGGGAPVDGALPLAYNGNMLVYSQYFPRPHLVLAGEAGERIISLCKL
jgi:hypothetical protein